MSSSPPQALRKPIRELLRKRGEPMSQEVKLQDRADNLVRMSLMKAAHEPYDEIPEKVTQWYLPDEHGIYIDLPEPDPSDDDDQLDFDSFDG